MPIRSLPPMFLMLLLALGIVVAVNLSGMLDDDEYYRYYEYY